MLRYTRIDHSIMYVHEVPEDKPVRYVSTFMNFNNMQKYMAYLNWGHVFGCWRPNAHTSITYQRFSVNDHGELISYNGVTWDASFDNYFTLPNDYQLSLSYSLTMEGKWVKRSSAPLRTGVLVPTNRGWTADYRLPSVPTTSSISSSSRSEPTSMPLTSPRLRITSYGATS